MTASETSEEEVAQEVAARPGPMCFEFDVRGARRKGKTSRRLRGVQAVERGWRSSGEVVLDSARATLRAWDKKSRASAKDSRDGVIEDAFGNAVDACTVGARRLVEAPSAYRRGLRKVWRGKKLGGVFRL